jgi:hypothetical protein
MQATYNDLTIAALGSLTPNFDWSVYLRALQSPEYLAQMDEVMKRSLSPPSV